ncbi:unnamed protein product, partial [Medioppia subpectinata]
KVSVAIVVTLLGIFALGYANVDPAVWLQFIKQVTNDKTQVMVNESNLRAAIQSDPSHRDKHLAYCRVITAFGDKYKGQLNSEQERAWNNFWPYARRLNETYHNCTTDALHGYVVDLMNEIANIVGFQYKLYLSPDGKYGSVINNSVNGMIAERADFAVADITVTDARAKYVDFTQPFIDYNPLVVLLHKHYAQNMGSFADLAASDLPYGTYRGGRAHRAFNQSDNPVIKRMYRHMESNPDNMVANLGDVLYEMVTGMRYGFITVSTIAEYWSGIYCNLTYVVDPNGYFPNVYAIAMPKGSVYISKFNDAIRQLKHQGELDRIKAKNWQNFCDNHDEANNIIVNTWMKYCINSDHVMKLYTVLPPDSGCEPIMHWGFMYQLFANQSITDQFDQLIRVTKAFFPGRFVLLWTSQDTVLPRGREGLYIVLLWVAL